MMTKEFISLRLKKILVEAFSKLNNIKVTASSCLSVFLEQIRQWWAMFAFLPVQAAEDSDINNDDDGNQQIC